MDRFNRFWTGVVITVSLSMAAFGYGQRSHRRRQLRRELKKLGA